MLHCSHIEMPKISGCFSTFKHPLVYALVLLPLTQTYHIHNTCISTNLPLAVRHPPEGSLEVPPGGWVGVPRFWWARLQNNAASVQNTNLIQNRLFGRTARTASIPRLESMYLWVKRFRVGELSLIIFWSLKLTCTKINSKHTSVYGPLF